MFDENKDGYLHRETFARYYFDLGADESLEKMRPPTLEGSYLKSKTPTSSTPPHQTLG